MAIPIKQDPPKIKKTPSRVLRSGDEDYDTLRKLACDLYLACQSMKSAHDFFRRATMGDDYVKIDSASSNASIWFARPENQSYLAFRKAEVYKNGFDEYCKMKGIEHSEFAAIQEKAYEDIANMSPAEIREKNFTELEMLKDETNDPQIKSQIIKQQTELMDAKYKDKGMDVTAEDRLIHFYLPAPICDKCPNKCEIEDQFKSWPDVDLNIDGEDDKA